MVFPLFKGMIVLTKTISKPLSNWLKLVLIHRFKKGSILFKWIGNKAHYFEIKVNRKILNSKDFYIKPLQDEVAITRGIEVFIEVFLIYFLITAMTIHELKKNAISGEQAKKGIKEEKANLMNNKRMICDL